MRLKPRVKADKGPCEAAGRDYLAAVGGAIREARGRLGVSQEKLAELCGLHRTYVGSVERGERNVSVLNLQRIGAALGASPAELLRRAESLIT